MIFTWIFQFCFSLKRIRVNWYSIAFFSFVVHTSVKQIPYSASIKVLSAYVHTCLPGHWPVAAKEPILVRINFTELLIGFFFPRLKMFSRMESVFLMEKGMRWEINQFENCLFAKMIDTNEKNFISIHLQISEQSNKWWGTKSRRRKMKTLLFALLFPYCGDERSSNGEHNK